MVLLLQGWSENQQQASYKLGKNAVLGRTPGCLLHSPHFKETPGDSQAYSKVLESVWGS